MSKYDMTCPRCGSKRGKLIELGVGNGASKVIIGHTARCDVCQLNGPMAADPSSAVYWWSQMSKLVREDA